VVPPAEHVPTTSTTVMDGPSTTPTTTKKNEEKLMLRGGEGSIEARTYPASTSGSPSFEDHQRHE
jgi:hypothetical protein